MELEIQHSLRGKISPYKEIWGHFTHYLRYSLLVLKLTIYLARD